MTFPNDYARQAAQARADGDWCDRNKLQIHSTAEPTLAMRNDAAIRRLLLFDWPAFNVDWFCMAQFLTGVAPDPEAFQ